MPPLKRRDGERTGGTLDRWAELLSRRLRSTPSGIRARLAGSGSIVPVLRGSSTKSPDACANASTCPGKPLSHRGQSEGCQPRRLRASSLRARRVVTTAPCSPRPASPCSWLEVTAASVRSEDGCLYQQGRTVHMLSGSPTASDHQCMHAVVAYLGGRITLGLLDDARAGPIADT